ncbi:MAG: exostosin family protein [Cyanobium sp.]
MDEQAAAGLSRTLLCSAVPLPWQQPNATEFFAGQTLTAAAPYLNQAYLAFPWATWIDRSRRGSPPELPPPSSPSGSGIRVTVCQHIWALEHLELFQRAGITDLFWSHATQGVHQIGDMRLHPFPLYPVRCSTHPLTEPLLPPTQRPLLYSFQGAYIPGLYLTPVREWLLELPPRPDAQLERHREWHYEQAVYREQVQGQAGDAARHAQLAAEADAYATILQRSCFALCPSGSGPNSIRLWEALGYGAIPVILSDQLQLPGPAELWQAAALMVPETQAAVTALPSQLEALASDPERMLAMQQAGQQLWRRYGMDGFVGDVVDLLRDPLTVLRSRALQQLPPGEPLEIQASHPAELPLLLLRNLRNQPPQRSVLIQINDTGPRELLRLRWQAALRLCKQQLVGRPAAMVSVAPELEGFVTDGVSSSVKRC